MNELQKCAEILVEYGYAYSFGQSKSTLMKDAFFIRMDTINNPFVNPFADTLEGRRQADAIEDYLQLKHISLWNDWSAINYERSSYKRRLMRIKWCIQQLTGDNDD